MDKKINFPKILLLIGMGMMIPRYLFIAGNTLFAPFELYDRNRAVLIVLTVQLTLKTPTFTRQHLKILLLIVVLLNLNFLWLKYVPINNIWISSLLRTVVLMGGGCAVAWAKNLSPEINQQLRSLGERLKVKG